MDNQLIFDIVLKWVLPMSIFFGMYLVFVKRLYSTYEKIDVDRIWRNLVKLGIIVGVLTIVWNILIDSTILQSIANFLGLSADWISKTTVSQYLYSKGNEGSKRVFSFLYYWIPFYFRAMVIVWTISTLIFIQSLIWRIQFTRCVSIILSTVFLSPYLTSKYFIGYQTPFFDYVYSRLFLAKLKENINDSWFDALQGVDQNGNKFDSGTGGSVQTQRIKAATIALRRTKSTIKTANGVRRAKMVTKKSRETDTDLLIEKTLKGFGDRVTASNIRFQENPVFNGNQGGYVFDSDVAYSAADVLGSWGAIFANPLARENKIKNGGDGFFMTLFESYREMIKYVKHCTPAAIYESIIAKQKRLYSPDVTLEKAKYVAQSNIDLSVIPEPVDPDTGNTIEMQLEIAQKVAKDRIEDISNALNAFKLSGTFDKVLVGGNTAIYQYTLPRSTTLPTDLSKVERGIAQLLKTNDIPMIEVRAGILSISMVNGVKIPVDFRRMIETREKGLRSIISGIAGVDAMGNNILVELGDTTPHCMLFGATGRGKTVTIMNILFSVMAAVDPTMLKVVAIDGKGNSFEFLRSDNKDSENYHPNPFMYAQPADGSGDIDYARALLKHIEKENRRRIELFKQRGVSKLSVFNEKYPGEKLCELLVVVDEFSALTDLDALLSSDEYVVKSITETMEYLAKMGRSCGIHLLAANQTARKEKVPGRITANISGRVTLGVNEPQESYIALPDSGIAVHNISQAGEFYSMMNGIRSIEHGNSPYLSDETMNSINDCLEAKFGHHDYVISREEVLKEMEEYFDEEGKLSYKIPTVLPTVETSIDDLLFLINQFPDWANANRESVVFKNNIYLDKEKCVNWKENKQKVELALEMSDQREIL
ncbi:FtsK/SpoIIIE domain-containing protein [Enterococcus mundtii]|uniref:FtsK/SpoIIIE domain-containing protein n=1 Tax=Enterococcus mundtii TaxID=53346 RepID=UPI000DF93E02|nr:FtsK/SpoIIIE domain-containing protein [Enterococcus mundtii]STE38131.1 cell division protein FtsK [Enterococcus mundtii]